MSWGMVVGAGASLLGGKKQSEAASDAANAQGASSAAAIAEQRRQFDLVMQMLGPQRALGNQAINTLGQLYGYGTYEPGTAPTYADMTPQEDVRGILQGGPLTLRNFANFHSPSGMVNLQPDKKPKPGTNGVISPGTEGQFVGGTGSPDMSVFFSSPDYGFRRDEGTRGIENSFAARGGAASGNALRALNEFNSNLASGEFGNFVNRQLAFAGMGQTATGQGVNAAQFTGGNISNLLGQQGNARASGLINQANIWGNTANDLASIWGARQRNNQTQQGGGDFWF